MIIKKEQSFAAYNLIKISLIESHLTVPNLGYEPEDELLLSLEIETTELNENNEFNVSLTLNAKEEKKSGFIIIAGYDAKFKLLEEDEKLKLDKFSRVNAPAIIYPYIRQHIRNLTLDAGFSNPVILPVLNFVKIEANREAGEIQDFSE